jgi:GT2 family glycosyltransferase
VSDPRLTVVVLTHDRAAEVATTVERLRRLPEAPRIVVVDNGSADGTATALRRRFPDTDVVSLGRNLGAAGRNIGVALATTAYVAFCDDDTWWAPGALARAADLLDRHPRLALVTGRVLVGPDEREDPACAGMAASPLLATPGLPGVPVLGFLCAATMVRRRPFLEAGGFERRFFLGGEEELLALDLAAGGWALAYVRDVVIHHHPSRRRDTARRRRLLLRNSIWCLWLRRPLRSALVRSVQRARPALADVALMPGLAAALAGLPWALRHRRVVPPVVEVGLRLIEMSREVSRAVRPRGA